MLFSFTCCVWQEPNLKEVCRWVWKKSPESHRRPGFSRSVSPDDTQALLRDFFPPPPVCSVPLRLVNENVTRCAADGISFSGPMPCRWSQEGNLPWVRPFSHNTPYLEVIKFPVMQLQDMCAFGGMHSYLLLPIDPSTLRRKCSYLKTTILEIRVSFCHWGCTLEGLLIAH